MFLTDSREGDDYNWYYRDLVSFEDENLLPNELKKVKEDSKYQSKPDFEACSRCVKHLNEEERLERKYIVYSNKDIEGMIDSLEKTVLKFKQILDK